jgi:hypothetical protein
MTDHEGMAKNLSAPKPDVLDERAREAAVELRKLLTSLATGAIGIFFLSLAGPGSLPLRSQEDRIIVGLSLAFMGLTVAFGILGWHADGRRNYKWARELEGRSELHGQRMVWQGIVTITGKLIRLTFPVGVAFALWYLIAGVISPSV